MDYAFEWRKYVKPMMLSKERSAEVFSENDGDDAEAEGVDDLDETLIGSLWRPNRINEVPMKSQGTLVCNPVGRTLIRGKRSRDLIEVGKLLQV